MIFEPAERTLLPTKDLLSYIFDDPPYDQDKPVGFIPRRPIPHLSEALWLIALILSRSISMFEIQRARFRATKPAN